LGLPWAQAGRATIQGLQVSLVMSHLACGSRPDHPLNQIQLKRFQEVSKQFPDIPASFANSAGVLLGKEYHFNQIRPGIGLYGGAPLDFGLAGPDLAPVARLLAPIIQTRSLRKGESVGYGAAFEAPQAMKIAVIAYGYADGLFRSASPKGIAHIDGKPVPLLGRVSMDLMMVDVSDIPGSVETGAYVEFWGEHLDEFANQCGTISYELLTSVGNRVKRAYAGESQ
jgi:alanine racemase